MRLLDLTDEPLVAVVQIDRDPKVDQPRARVVPRRTPAVLVDEGAARRRRGAGTATSDAFTGEASPGAGEPPRGSSDPAGGASASGPRAVSSAGGGAVSGARVGVPGGGLVMPGIGRRRAEGICALARLIAEPRRAAAAPAAGRHA
jgi:hypothetical protein